MRYVGFLQIITSVWLSFWLTGCFVNPGQTTTPAAPNLNDYSLVAMVNTATTSGIQASLPCPAGVTSLMVKYSSSLTSTGTMDLVCVNGFASATLPIQNGLTSQNFTLQIWDLSRNVYSSSASINFSYSPAGVPTQLVFSNTPSDPSPTAGQVLTNQPVVQVLDVTSRLVVTASNVIQLNYYTDAGCTSAASSGTFSVTANNLTPTVGIATFAGLSAYTIVGTYYVGATSAGLTTACSGPIVVGPAAPSALTWTSTPSNQPLVNGCTGPYKFNVVDQYGNISPVAALTTVNLNQTGGGGFFTNGTCGTGTASVNVAAGNHSGHFYFEDPNWELNLTLTASTAGLSSAIMSVSVLTQAVVSGPTATAGVCTQYAVTNEDANGVAVTVPVAGGPLSGGPLSLTLAGENVVDNYYSNNGCTASISDVSIAAGSSSTTFYSNPANVLGFSPGTFAAVCGGNPCTLEVLSNLPVIAASADHFTMIGPTFIPTGGCSQAYYVSAEDPSNNLANVGAPTVVTLATTGGGQFYSNATCTSATAPSVTIAMGTATSPAFYYKAAAPEAPTLTGSGSLTSGTFAAHVAAASQIQQVAVTTGWGWGGTYFCVVANGDVKCVGSNIANDISGSNPLNFTPVQITNLTSGVTDISNAEESACAVVGGGVQCWGVIAGETGTPVVVAGLPGTITQVSVSTNNACAVSSGGAVYCWCDNPGLNGINGAACSTTAAQVAGISNATQVSVSDSSLYACAFITGGQIMCWGDNTYGELGNGTTNSSDTPVAVSGISSATSMSNSMAQHTCAVVSGQSWCWGSNGYGALGNGSATGTFSTTPVESLTSGVTQVAGGGIDNGSGLDWSGTTFAIQSGALFSWGSNYGLGRLGASGNSDSTVPVAVTGMSSGVTQVSAGGGACAIQNGNILCWGGGNYGAGNGSGETGTGSTTFPLGNDVPNPTVSWY